MKRVVGCTLLIILLFSVFNQRVYAEEEKNDVYDSLQESIKESWNNGFEELETTDEIETEGPFMERILRSIANVFYKNMVGIKGWSILIGLISIVVGTFIAITAKLNKKLRKFAISFLIITIPCLLIVFVFGIAKFVSVFV